MDQTQLQSVSESCRTSVTTEDLYKVGIKIMTLQRANTAHGMTDAAGNQGTNDFRGIYDIYTERPFSKDANKVVFSEGTDRMNKDDIQNDPSMVYRTFGWDEQSGCPIAACLNEHDMPDVEEELQGLGLLP